MIRDWTTRCAGLALLTAMGVMAAPADVIAQEAETAYIEYKVVRGDTCIGIARKVYKNGDLCYELIAGSNEFDAKFRVYPGQILKLPTKETLERQKVEREGTPVAPTAAASTGESAPDARLRSFQGTVEARPPDAETWQKARQDKDLWRRWRVNSSARSSAEVFFQRERATLRMRENTLVVIYGEASQESAPSTARHAVLERGQLSSRLGELAGADIGIETPAANVQTNSGDALLNVLEGGTTLVANHSNSAGLRVSGKKPRKKKTDKPVIVTVPENMGTRVEPGKDPSTPQPLPSSPKWSQPDVAAMSSGGLSRAVARWETVPGVVAWRVELWRGVELLDAIALDGAVSEAAFDDLALGTYELRIATIDRSGFESKMSAPLPLTVYEVFSQEMSEAQRQRAERGELYVGEALRLSERVSCEVDGRAVPSGVVSLNRVGSHELLCKDERGARLDPLSFVVRPNGAKLTLMPDGPVKVGEVTQVELELEHPLDSIDVTPPEGFRLASAPTREGSTWRIPLLAVSESQGGVMRVGTPGVLGATLLKVPLTSQGVEVLDQEEIIAREIEQKPLRLSLGAVFGLRGFGEQTDTLGGVAYEADWRVGLRVGLVIYRAFVLEFEGDTGFLRPIIPTEEIRRAQTLGALGAVSYRIGAWPVRPFVRVGGGGEWALEGGANRTLALAGGGLLFSLKERVELRLDVQQLFTFEDDTDRGQLTSATLGFSGVF